MNWKRPLALSTAALTLGMALAACGNPTAAAPDPVSYTHLDVYKRQLLGRSRKCPIEATT